MARRLHSDVYMHTVLTETPSSAYAGEARTFEAYDLVILGSGTGSTLAARTFAGQGQRVAVIERRYIGGSCPNIVCLPSKNIFHSARVASYFRRGKEFGLAADGFHVDMTAVRARKRTDALHSSQERGRIASSKKLNGIEKKGL